MKIRDIDPSEATRQFTYDPETGILRLRIKNRKRPAGTIVGCSAKNPREKGRITLRFMGMTIRAHVIIWAIQTGTWPPEGRHIDHVNGDPSDNRWENLRISTPSQNAMNSAKPITNKSGYKGVTLIRTTGKWMACIRINKKSKYLGCFNSPEEAALAYRNAADENFKEFARY